VTESFAAPRTDLRGQTALVTGGSGGIGSAIAAALAAAGAAVTVSYNANKAGAESLVARIEAAGGTALAVQADLRERQGVATIFRRHLERFGGLRILVNNAGDMVERVPTAETSEALWRSAIDLNLSSVFFACQEAIGPMSAQKSGRIINISSVGARTGGGAGSIPYHAAKAGVLALTKGLARELAPHLITVNAVAPGIIETAFHDRHSKTLKDEWVRTLVPLQTAGRPQDVASAVTFLASEAAGYITGATLDVNGGMAMY
jgi:3-oxoacyl-[acyl-carrier protein] reductase